MSSNIEKRLSELGVVLPAAGAPAGNYIPFVVVGNLVFLSGQVAREAGKMKYVGKLGRELTVEQGYQQARTVGLSILGSLKRALGDLDRVQQWNRVFGMVSIQGVNDVLSMANSVP